MFKVILQLYDMMGIHMTNIFLAAGCCSDTLLRKTFLGSVKTDPKSQMATNLLTCILDNLSP